jgi:RNA polymerase sigma-70 factor (ECF subfamily)
LKDTATVTETFVQLLEQHQKLILKVASVYYSEAEARKDLSQEIILQLWKAFPKYNSTYKFSTWAYRIALNVAISNYRMQSTRQRTRNAYLNDRDWLDWEDPKWNEAIEALYRCIGQLKPLDRALIVLYLDAYSGAEIAEIMGITETNVSTRIYRIKQQLKDCVKP